MKPEILTRYKDDEIFSKMVWAIMAMRDGQCNDCEDNIDFTCVFEDFLLKEYGITENDLEQLWIDDNREFDEWEANLPKCCNRTDYSRGQCEHCGKDFMDIPGLWEAWHCNTCKEIHPGCFARKPPMPRDRCKFLNGKIKTKE